MITIKQGDVFAPDTVRIFQRREKLVFLPPIKPRFLRGPFFSLFTVDAN
jgi:hypothetical protein